MKNNQNDFSTFPLLQFSSLIQTNFSVIHVIHLSYSDFLSFSIQKKNFQKHFFKKKQTFLMSKILSYFISFYIFVS